MHIGLIGGIGPAATVYYYQLLIEEIEEQSLTISHASIKRLSENIMAGNQEEQATIFAKHVDSLKSAGANFAAVTSVAGHFCFDELSVRSSLPLVSVLDSLRAYFLDRGIKRVGVLGNHVAMRSHLFGMIDTVSFVTPDAGTLNKVGDAYMNMAKRGWCDDHERQIFINAGQHMMDQSGADAVLLGGTDLFLAFNDNTINYPVVDAARVHVADLIKASQ